MGVFLIILGFVLIAGGYGFSIYRLREHKKAGNKHSFDKKCFYYFLALGGINGLGGLLTNIGYTQTGKWAIDPGHMAMLLIGGFIFYAAMYFFFITFYLRYWRTDLEESNKKYIGLFMVISPLVALFAFILAGEGMGPYLTYPLVKGFVIGSNGFEWTRPGEAVSGGLHIQWYGVLIVGGAVLAYKMSDHNFYKKFGKHGILDSVFLLAFPAGIIGARIGYVVGNWDVECVYVEGSLRTFHSLMGTPYWWKIFALWEGGLTILAGAVGGILVGSIFFLCRRKYADLRFAFDAVVPNILIAQAIGRFGNFFNHEVYGTASSMSAWPLVPTWIRNNMAIGWVSGAPINDQMYAPMFVIEAVLNVIGFFVITQLLARVWKKGRALGDCLGLYLVWYGTVRIILEPMRDSDFNMGSDGWWSIWNAMGYIIGGVVAIVILHLIQHYRKKHGLPYERGELVPVTEGTPSSSAAVESAPAGDLDKPKPIKRGDLDKPKPIKRQSATKPAEPSPNEEEGEK